MHVAILQLLYYFVIMKLEQKREKMKNHQKFILMGATIVASLAMPAYATDNTNQDTTVATDSAPSDGAQKAKEALGNFFGGIKKIGSVAANGLQNGVHNVANKVAEKTASNDASPNIQTQEMSQTGAVPAKTSAVFPPAANASSPVSKTSSVDPNAPHVVQTYEKLHDNVLGIIGKIRKNATSSSDNNTPKPN